LKTSDYLKKWGIYLVGAILILVFAALLVVRPRVLAEKNKFEKPVVKGTTTSSAPAINSAHSPSPASNSATPATTPAPTVQSVPVSPSPVSPSSQSQVASESPAPAPTQTETPVVPKETVTLVIDSLGTYTVNINDGDTVFDVLKNASNQNTFTIDYVSDPTWGAFVTQIGSVGYSSTLGYNSPDGKYWFLYINGQTSADGVSSAKVKNSDQIEFKYETPSW
jgi:hypothetical protein